MNGRTPLRARPGSLRIIAGAWRRRNIEGPLGDAIRPTADRVREALFNRLMHGFSDRGFRLQGARVADVFAGTGALGLEALSRGAAQATFIERDLQAVELIRRNIAKLGAEDRAIVVSAEAAALPRAHAPCDLALLDPPYGEGLAAPALLSLAHQGWLKPGALVSVETAADEPMPEITEYAILDRHTYGRAAIAILAFKE